MIIEHISSRSLVFAAHDTTTTALSRLLLLLAEHPKWQDLLRDEIKQATEDMPDGRIEYEKLSSLPVMDAIVRETLRV